MILRIYSWAVFLFTAVMLVLSILSVPHILEVIIIGLGGLVCLLILAMSAFIQKVNSNVKASVSAADQ